MIGRVDGLRRSAAVDACGLIDAARAALGLAGCTASPAQIDHVVALVDADC